MSQSKRKETMFCLYVINHSKFVYAGRHIKLKFRRMKAISEFVLLWHSYKDTGSTKPMVNFFFIFFRKCIPPN